MKTADIYVTNVQYIDDYQVKLTFSNSEKKIIDLEPYLWGEAFEPLKNIDFFRKVQCSEELGTIFWPNGVDIAPESLYE